jgi:hypothetical protein
MLDYIIATATKIATAAEYFLQQLQTDTTTKVIDTKDMDILYYNIFLP